VDSDHRRLTEFALEINRFIDLMDEAQVDLASVEHERALLQQLLEFTKDHFQREEALIERYKLEGLDSQRAQHARIVTMLQERVGDYEAGRLTTTLSLKLAVLEWLVVHINGIDVETFKLEKWRHVLRGARIWDDVSEVIRATGVTWLDQEHRTSTEMTLNLIHAVRTSADGVRSSESTDQVERLFDGVRRYIEQHFVHEVDFLRQYGLPEVDFQEGQHEQFLEMLTGHKQDFVREGSAIADKFEQAVLEWWVNHINEIDYASYSMDTWAHKVLGKAKTWKEAAWMIHQTGIQEVDEDHHRLVEIGMELNELIAGTDRDSDAAPAVLAIFDRLLELSRDHFRREERLMLERRLEIYPRHRREHQDLLKMIEEHRAHFAAGRVGLSEELKIRIMEWWIRHTNGIDSETFGGDGKVADEGAEQ